MYVDTGFGPDTTSSGHGVETRDDNGLCPATSLVNRARNTPSLTPVTPPQEVDPYAGRHRVTGRQLPLVLAVTGLSHLLGAASYGPCAGPMAR